MTGQPTPDSMLMPLPSGDPAIDDDHRQLAKLATAFRIAATAQNLPRAMILFETLLTGLQAHFKREELMLADYGDDDLAAHCQEHEQVMRDIMRIRSDAFLLLRAWPLQAADLACHLVQRCYVHDLESSRTFGNGVSGLRPMVLPVVL